MNITTKGHVENINNDKHTTNSWLGSWDESQGSGSIATINTHKKGEEPVNVIEDYKPITNADQLKQYMDPRMDMYFALRTKPRVETDPAVKIHDDLTKGALVDKLEHLLKRDPKVIVFKPQNIREMGPSSEMSMSSRSPSKSSRSSSRSRSRSPSRSSSRSPSKSSSRSPSKSSRSRSPSKSSRSRSSSKSSRSPSKSKSSSKTKQTKHYATPKRRTITVQTRKKKTPTPKKKKTPTPKKKKTPTPKKKKTPENEIGGFTPPTINLKNAVKAITPKLN